MLINQYYSKVLYTKYNHTNLNAIDGIRFRAALWNDKNELAFMFCFGVELVYNSFIVHCIDTISIYRLYIPMLCVCIDYDSHHKIENT